MTLLAVLGSLIFALLAVISWLLGKKGTSDAILKNNDVKDQLNTLDGQLAKNQALIEAEKQALQEKKAKTNDEVLKGINSKPNNP